MYRHAPGHTVDLPCVDLLRVDWFRADLLRVLLCCLLLCCAFVAGRIQAAPLAPSAAPAISIVYAEQPVRLLRATSVAKAARGALLAPNDLIETAGSVQLRAGGVAIALGAGTRLFIRNGADLVLLAGWMKLNTPAGDGVTSVSSAGLQFAGAGATVIVHAVPGMTELFVESGEIAVAELAGAKPGRRVKLAHEQYAMRSGAAALRQLARPPGEFIAAMPPAFLDPLAALSFAGPAPAVKVERAASVADYAPLLAEHPALRQQVARRFAPPPPAGNRIHHDMF